MLAARPPQPSLLPSYTSTSSIPTLQSYPTNASSPDTTDSPSTADMTQSPIIRQWTLQPRPKPGRKPALDTPPTKRKAQNREAQRAFRERRAQRVGELEDHIKQEQSVFQHKQAQWEQMERTLVGNINGWRERAEFWEARARGMEGQLTQLQEMNGQLREEIARLQSMWTAQANAPTLPSISSLTDMNPLIGVDTNELPESCKSCGDGGKCACMDAVMDGVSMEIKEEDDQPMEIDFTTSRIGTIAEPIVLDSTIMEEGCGFCSKPGGASCPCREAANANSSMRAQLDTAGTSPSSAFKIKPSTAQPEKTAPSEAPKQGPGSCAACQSDPERRRFCQTLAGLMPPPARPDAPINSNSDTDVTRRPIAASRQSSNPTPMPTSIADANFSPLPTLQLSTDPNARISCADAYTHFKQLPPGTRDRAEFVQQLRAHPAQHGQSTPSLRHSVPGTTNTTAATLVQPCSNTAETKEDCGGRRNGLKCNACNDVGCAPLEVDAASVLTAMRMGLAADTRFTAASNVMRRESSLDGDEGSD